MFVRNLARAYHKKKVPALLFKLDISKAFDTVSCEYMLELLAQRGFSVRWREWLTSIFKTSHSTVLLNGAEGKRMNHARGLRQGDPLSPYLFILAIDTLHHLLELATTNGILSPLRGRNVNLRLSLYANDAIIFINPVKEEVQALFGILEQFGDATGLKLNLEKCTVTTQRSNAVVLISMTSSTASEVQRSTSQLLTLGCRSP
jgi:mannosylglycoprotein endo-beta-mannosidase